MFKKKSTELNRSFSGSTASSSSSSPGSSRNATVLAVECISGGLSSSSSDANQWSGVLHTGDIVEEIQIGNQLHRSPFRDGNPGVQKLLRRCFRDRQVSITVRVQRSGGEGSGQMQAFVAESGSGGKTQYVLRGVHDPEYAVRFFDRTEAECFQLQATFVLSLQQLPATSPSSHDFIFIQQDLNSEVHLHPAATTSSSSSHFRSPCNNIIHFSEFEFVNFEVEFGLIASHFIFIFPLQL